MNVKYLAIFNKNSRPPERQALVNKSWGDLPTSYIQGGEKINDSDYLDIKVNKWEVNPLWSKRQSPEPFIRIEILKDKKLNAYLKSFGLTDRLAVESNFAMAIELDEGEIDIDQALMLNLLAVLSDFSEIFKLTRDDASFEKIIVPSLLSVDELYKLINSDEL
ncbi:hypothetical protein [Pseudomonas entomophila]|uniref:hypothetical protein n=1 Tax=Pseudomonas entomophila TaxID=312306 RepID=UPI003EBED1FB